MLSVEPDTDDEGESSTAATSLDTLVQQKQYAPFVNGVFGGKLNSFIICDECKHISMTQEDFFGISLPLKSDESKLRKRDKLRRSLQGNFFNSKAKIEAAKKNENIAVVRPAVKSQISLP
ncbi:hypothetical protein BT69DRAFT_89524 [Atractiella rhizophila]|nr:hypothetical protein BT69DRAFT_89524 [Atractiella rhizophila]